MFWVMGASFPGPIPTLAVYGNGASVMVRDIQICRLPSHLRLSLLKASTCSSSKLSSGLSSFWRTKESRQSICSHTNKPAVRLSTSPLLTPFSLNPSHLSFSLSPPTHPLPLSFLPPLPLLPSSHSFPPPSLSLFLSLLSYTHF